MADKKPETPIIDEATFKQVIAEVTAELQDVLKSEKVNLESTLAKANQGEDTTTEPQPDTSATDTAPAKDADPAPAVEAKGDDVPAAAPPSEPEAPAAEPAAADPVAAEAEAIDQGPVDVAQLTEMYCQLPQDEVEAHYVASREALLKMKAAAQPAPAAPAAPPAAAPAPAIAQKSEKDLKLEQLEKKAIEDSEKIEKLSLIVEKLASIPLRKSITSLDQLPVDEAKKTGKMSKEQIDAALTRVISSQKLTKHDADLIVGWELGKVKVDEIAHLLK